MTETAKSGGADPRERLVVLACSDCGEERPHKVRYRNDAVAEMRCTACGRAIVLSGGKGEAGAGEDGEAAGRTDAGSMGRGEGRFGAARGWRAAAVALSLRAATKPFRVWRQARREGRDVWRTMPGRVATKPLRLVREFGRDSVGARPAEDASGPEGRER